MKTMGVKSLIIALTAIMKSMRTTFMSLITPVMGIMMLIMKKAIKQFISFIF